MAAELPSICNLVQPWINCQHNQYYVSAWSGQPNQINGGTNACNNHSVYDFLFDSYTSGWFVMAKSRSNTIVFHMSVRFLDLVCSFLYSIRARRCQKML